MYANAYIYEMYWSFFLYFLIHEIIKINESNFIYQLVFLSYSSIFFYFRWLSPSDNNFFYWVEYQKSKELQEIKEETHDKAFT